MDVTTEKLVVLNPSKNWFKIFVVSSIYAFSISLGLADETSVLRKQQSYPLKPTDAPRFGTADAKLLSDVEDFSFQYVQWFVTQDHYLASLTQTSESHVDGLASTRDIRAFYGVDTRKGEKRLRIELVGNKWTTQFEQPEVVNERKLEVPKHHYLERSGAIFDVFGRDPQSDPFTDVYWPDPKTLPVEYANAMTDHASNNEIVNYMMPAGKLFAAAKTPSGKFVGWWWHGAEERLGYTQVVFDPEVDHLPVEFRIYIHSSDKEMTADNLADTTAPYQTTLTRWAKHPSETFVPVEVVCQQFRPYQTGWRAQMRWWLGEQVPDAIFTLEDFQRSRARVSLLQELTKQITEESATTTDSPGS